MWIFSAASVLAIAAGGLLAAFSARKPDKLKIWMSAYLVLIVGLVQLGLVTAWQATGATDFRLALAAFVMYNLGNGCVLLGTMYKTGFRNYSLVVNFGGLALAAAMVLLLVSVRDLQASWTLAGFIALVLVILVSMPIGLVMSARRKPKRAKIAKARAQ